MKESFWDKQGTLANQLWSTGKADFPIYDVHGHMGTHNIIYFNRCEPAEVVEHLKRTGVSRLVFSHHHVLFGSMRNKDVYEMCRQYPEYLRMYAGIIPRFPDFIREDLANYDKWAPYCVGLKFLADYYNLPLTDPKWEYALKWADERGVPCLFHTWGGSPCDGGKIMYELTQKYQNIKFLLGHCICGEFDEAIKCVNDSPKQNVWLELTAIPGSRGIVEKLVENTNSKRVLFGTDMPWFDEYQVIGGIMSAKIDEEAQKDILYRNAEDVFGKDF